MDSRLGLCKATSTLQFPALSFSSPIPSSKLSESHEIFTRSKSSLKSDLLLTFRFRSVSSHEGTTFSRHCHQARSVGPFQVVLVVQQSHRADLFLFNTQVPAPSWMRRLMSLCYLY